MTETIITPPLGLSIPGGFHPYPALRVDDDLYAKICYFDDGESAVAIIVVDHVETDKAVAQPIREAVASKLGIPVEAVTFECTHDHSGGPILYLPVCAEPDADYVAFMTQRIVDAAYDAQSNAEECVIGAAVGHIDNVSFCRRYFMRDGSLRTWPGYSNPDAVRAENVPDPDVTVIRVDRPDGSPIGLITNFACHATAHTGQAYSGDYPAGISAAVKSALGEDVVSLYINGASADVTHIDWEERVFSAEEIGDGGHYMRMGRMIGYEALKTRELCRTSGDVKVSFASEEVELALRLPTDDEYAEAVRYIDANPDLTLDPREGYYKLSTKLLYEMGSTPTFAEVQVMRLGDIALAFFPMEMFSSAGRDVKRRSVAGTTIVGATANDSLGYVPPTEELGHGGYEATLGWTSHFAAGTSERLVDAAAELIRNSELGRSNTCSEDERQ